MSKTVISDLIKIFKNGVSAVLPENLIRNSLKFNPTSQTLSIFNDRYDIEKRKVFLVGTGKAVQSMAIETEQILGTKIQEGIISIPVNSLKTHSSLKIQYLEGAKDNLPDLASETTSKKIYKLAKNLGSDDLLLVLISGGGSALLPLPKEPISLNEKTSLVKTLANSGADITELNIVRKKLSAIKGGKLAIIAQPATVISLVLSDIVGDPLDLIASGLTVENKDDFGDARKIVEKYTKLETLPESIQTVLSETQESEHWPDNVRNYIIGSNKLSIAGAVTEIEKLKYTPIVLSTTITGNVINVAEDYFNITLFMCNCLSGKNQETFLSNTLLNSLDLGISDLKTIDLKEGICLVFGGESTVEVKGTGKGGRNQHLALEYSNILHKNREKLEDFEVYILSAGTDGIDGPTDAAGAVGYKDLVADAINENMDVQKYLDNNDTYNFYKMFKNGSLHVITGHTGTNVMDLQIIFIKKR